MTNNKLTGDSTRIASIVFESFVNSSAAQPHNKIMITTRESLAPYSHNEYGELVRIKGDIVQQLDWNVSTQSYSGHEHLDISIRPVNDVFVIDLNTEWYSHIDVKNKSNEIVQFKLSAKDSTTWTAVENSSVLVGLGPEKANKVKRMNWF
jgi:hypothetical protein